MGANAEGAVGANPGADPGGHLIVFAQRPEPLLEVEAWNKQGERFFSLRVGLAEPLEGGARLVVAPGGQAPGVRSVRGRRRNDQDLLRADAAEARQGGGGLALLARRCDTVWLVQRLGSGDTLALQLAAVIASVMLGPILDAESGELFGANTARAKIRRATA